jgi:hypothetical protein
LFLLLMIYALNSLEPNDARVPKHSRYWKNDPLPPHLAAARLGGGAGRGGRVTPHRAHRSGHQPLLYTNY